MTNQMIIINRIKEIVNELAQYELTKFEDIEHERLMELVRGGETNPALLESQIAAVDYFRLTQRFIQSIAGIEQRVRSAVQKQFAEDTAHVNALGQSETEELTETDNGEQPNGESIKAETEEEIIGNRKGDEAGTTDEAETG